MYFGTAEKKWNKIRTHKWKRKLSTEVNALGMFYKYNNISNINVIGY